MSDHVDAVIKVKRGLESQRRGIVFADGELAYSTDVKRLFVGDGGLGGNPTSSKTYFGNTTPTYAISGDFYVDTTTNICKLYVLTAADYSNISSYGLISDNSPAWDVYNLVQANSAGWGSTANQAGVQAYTTVVANSSYWQATYSTVKANSATWSSGSITAEQYVVNSVVKSSSANWNASYSTVYGQSAYWNSTYTTVKSQSANWGLFANATVQTFSTPLTASGKFMVFTINGTQQALMLWDTP
jgi:Major tropism determinant N-terminal domain